MLTVGVDTFISVEDADKYVDDNYFDKPSFLDKWKSLTVEQKESCLRRNTGYINNLKYYGNRLNLSQPLAFPRYMPLRSAGTVYIPYISQLVNNQYINCGVEEQEDLKNGLKVAGIATIVNSLYELRYSDVIEESTEQEFEGLVSVKVGPVAETYNKDRLKKIEIDKGIYSRQVKNILSQWLIC